MSARTFLMLAAPIAAMLACNGSPTAGSREQPATIASEPSPSEPSPSPSEEKQPVAVTQTPTPERSAQPSGPVELTPIPGADAAGPVYFVINTLGVAKLDETGTMLVLDKPERNLQDLFVGPDGAVYLVDARSLRKLEGDAAVEVVAFGYGDVAPVDQVAIAPDRSIWVTGSRGVGRYAGGRWTVETRESLGLGFASELAVGFDGTAWLAGSTKLLRRATDEQGWSPVDVSALGRALLLLQLTASPTGTVFATNGQQLIRIAGTKAEPSALPGAESIGAAADLSVAADGSLALASGGCDLLRFGPDARGEPWRLGRDGYACETLEAMALDARSRIWVASREGLSVIDSAGAVVEFPAGSFAALAGRVSHVAVVGRGPELPQAPEVATASLSGKILVEGEPLGKAKLEVCPTVQLVGEGSPCSKAARRFSTTTGTKGQFVVKNVPIGDYSFAVEIDGNWRWTSPPSFAAQLRPGETHELGALALAKN